MATPDVVFFDLGDVVCRFVPEERSRAMADCANLDETEIASRLWGSGFSADADLGRYDLAQMCAQINSLLQAELDERTIMDCWRQAFVVDESVLSLAARVGMRTQVGMLTNNAPVLRAALPIWFGQIENLFDPLFFSYQFGVKKPATEIFEKVSRQGGFGTPLLVDDSIANIEAARGCGWGAIHFTGAERLAGDLEKLGLL